MENEKIENPFKGMQMPASFRAKLADWKKPKVTDLRIGRERDFILEYTETMTLKRNVNVDNGAVTETFTFKREGIRKFKHDAFLQHWIEKKQEEARKNRDEGIDHIIFVHRTYEIVDGIPREIENFGERGRQLMSNKINKR